MLRSQPVNLRGRFVFLDGLRGLAAVAVAFFHFFNHWVSPIHDRLAMVLPWFVQRILEHADMGVEVFFVLSGFVIAHSLFGQRITPRFAGNFALRRSIRLDPPYWAVLLVSISWPYLVWPNLVQGMFSKFGGVTGLLVNMFYLPDLLWRPRIVGVAWTLCLEVQFYLAYLLLIAMVQLLQRRGARLGSAAAGFIFGVLAVYSIHRWFTLGKNDFGGRWFMFFSGAMLYWTLRGRIDRRVMILYLAMLTGLSIWFLELRTGMIALTTAIIFIAAIFGGLQTWLSGRWIQYLGRISYSFYLVHMTVGVMAIGLVMKFSSGSRAMVFVAFAVGLAAATAAAELLCRLVELPAHRFAKRLKPASEQPAGVVHLPDISAPDRLAPILVGEPGRPPASTSIPGY